MPTRFEVGEQIRIKTRTEMSNMILNGNIPSRYITPEIQKYAGRPGTIAEIASPFEPPDYHLIETGDLVWDERLLKKKPRLKEEINGPTPDPKNFDDIFWGREPNGI